MNTRTVHRTLIAAAGASALFLMAFLAGRGRSGQAELRIAINPWPGCEFLYLAKEKGFFAQEGLNVRLIECASLSDCRVAFESSQVDAMTGTLVEVIQARENSRRSPQVVLVTDYSNGADVMLGGAGMTSVADLKGRRVGLELGSLGVLMLARSLEQAGMNLSDVKMVSCAPDEMESALAGGTVDTVVTYPPTSVGIEAGGQARRLFSSADIPGEVVDVVAVDAQWLQRDPSLEKRLAQAMQRALDFAQAHPRHAYALMGRREGLSGEEFEKALEGVHLVNAAGQRGFLGQRGSLRRSLHDVEAILRTTGQIRAIQRGNDAAPPANAVASKTEQR